MKITNPNTGTEISFVFHRPKSEPQSVALLCPGFLDSKDYFGLASLGKALADNGHLVLRFDSTGTWDSGGTTADYSATNYLTDIRSCLDFLKRNVVKPRKMIIIGHSFGGMMAIVAGEKFNDITHVVALTPPADLVGLSKRGPWGTTRLKQSKRDLSNDPAEFKDFAVPYKFIEDGLQYSAIESVRKLNKPLMILISTADENIPREEQEALISAANNPFVVRIDNLSHNFRFSNEQTDAVVRKVIDFLNSY